MNPSDLNPQTQAKQLALVLETYIPRDVSKIVYEYFFDGFDAFVYGDPRFELQVCNIDDSLEPYKDIFDDGMLIETDSETDSETPIHEFMKTPPSFVLDKCAGTLQLLYVTRNLPQLKLTFKKRFPVSSQHGYPENMVFFIVELKTNQVVFTYFPNAYQRHDNGNEETFQDQDFYMDDAFQYGQPGHAKTEIEFKTDIIHKNLFSVEHKETQIILYFSHWYDYSTDQHVHKINNMKRFTSKFDSKYPL
jgi:hypothetical protein